MPRKPSKKALEKEHCELSWWLIERKVAYYAPEEIHESWGKTFETSDDVYDQQEKRYLELCRELGHWNTVVHKGHPGFEDVPGGGMMEIDRDRPSVQLVLKKLGADRWRR